MRVSKDGFTAQVGFGSPTTTYSLLIDTGPYSIMCVYAKLISASFVGSANTWVGSRPQTHPYKKTSTSVNTGKAVSVSYDRGEFTGTEYTDTVTLSSNLVISKQSIGVASSSSGFDDVDGVLGLAPVDSTEGTGKNIRHTYLTVSDVPFTVNGLATVPTVSLNFSASREHVSFCDKIGVAQVADNLHSQGKISTEVIGISFLPTISASDATGELSFGGADTVRVNLFLHLRRHRLTRFADQVHWHTYVYARSLRVAVRRVLGDHPKHQIWHYGACALFCCYH